MSTGQAPMPQNKTDLIAGPRFELRDGLNILCCDEAPFDCIGEHDLHSGGTYKTARQRWFVTESLNDPSTNSPRQNVRFPLLGLFGSSAGPVAVWYCSP